MKEIAVAAVALLLGLVLGGLPVRGDLREAEAKVADLEARPCQEGVGKDLARFFGGARTAPIAEPLRPPNPTPGPRELAEANPEAAALAAEIDEAELQIQAETAEGLRDALEERSEELELARAALELRKAQARAALIEEADPDGAQLETIDAAYDAMNGELQRIAASLGKQVLDGGEPDRREAMAFAADALDAMLLAEDEVLGALDPEQRQDLSDGAINPFSHVDPGLVDILLELGAQP